MNQTKAVDAALHAQLVDILAEAKRRIQIHASNASHAKRKAKAKLGKDAQERPAGKGQEGHAKTNSKKTGDAAEENGGEARGGRGGRVAKQAAKAKASGSRKGDRAAAAKAAAAKAAAAEAAAGASGEDIE